MGRLHEVDADTTLATELDAILRKFDLLISNSLGASLSSRTVFFFVKHVQEDTGKLIVLFLVQLLLL